MHRRLLAVVTLGGILSSVLAALPAPTAASSTVRTAARPARLEAASSGLRAQPAPRPANPRLAMLLALARDRWLRGRAGTAARPDLAARMIGQAAIGAATRMPVSRPASVITGVVHEPGGQPVAGACVTATGPAGSVVARSRADGKYLVTGLAAGQYTLSVRDCAGRAAASRRSPASALWPGLPAQIAVEPGQTRALPPITMHQAGTGTVPADPAPAGSATSQAGTGAISGRVTGRGHPLLGICVAAEPLTSGIVRVAVTSKTGKYRITGLAPARYRVVFSAQFGCGSNSNWLQQWYPGITTPFDPANAAAIRVRAGHTRTGIDASLKLGSAISGTVRSRSGRPLSGICVEIQGRVTGGFVGFVFASHRRGGYALHGLFPGRYRIAFSIGCGNTGNYAPQWWRLRTRSAHATPITIKGAKPARHIDAALDPGAAISGTVRAVNSTGKPLAGICVSAGPANAVTRKDGTYLLKGLAGGRYVVDFDPSCFGQTSRNFLGATRRVRVAPGQSLAGVNVFLQRGAGVSGVVTDSHGHPLDGICVQIASRRGNAFAETDVDGSYSFGGLPAGSYQVQFTGGCGSSGSLAPQYYKNQPSAGSADVITLAPGQINGGIDAAMKPGATITGVVTDAAGHRLNDICVGVADQSLLFFGDVFNDIEFTSAGSYRAVNLAPGQYQVDFGCGGGRYADHWFRTKAGAFPSSLLSVPAGGTSGVSAVLRPGGAISGVVTDKDRHPISDACLYVVDARTGEQVLSSVFQGDVDNGRYKITGLGAARYEVFFYGCGTKYASQWYHGRARMRNADPVRVRAGHTTTGIGAALAVGGMISGQVVAQATGKPVRNECVDAFDRATQAFGFAQTGKTGHYTMRGLATGSYTVSFSPCYARGPNLASSTRASLVRVTAPHAVTGINARLGPGGSVSGTVTGGSHLQTGTCVELVPTGPAGGFGFAFTGFDGTYTATGLAAGAYHVYFNDPGCGFGVPEFAGQWYSGQPTEATASAVTVSAGSTTSGIDATLQPLGTIAGTVTDRAHAPVAGECVTAVPVGADFAGLVPREIAISTKSGGYTLVGMQPGTYKVRFSTGCGASGFATQWWHHASTRAAAKVVTVGAGAKITGIDAKLSH